MAEDILYRPRDIYEKMLKRQFHDGAEDYFEKLAKESGVDRAGNAVHVKAYNEAKSSSDEAKKKYGRVHGWGIFLVVMTIIGFVLGVVGLIARSPSFLLIIGIVGIVLGIVCLILRLTLIRNKLKTLKTEAASAEEAARKKYQVCLEDMVPLNNLFDWNMPQKIMDEAIEILKIDPYFKPARLKMMMDRFGMKEETDPFTSVVGVTSGEINGNPFLLERVLVHDVHDKAYVGSIVITWTTTSRDSQGHLTTQTHTQTLTATTFHPAPFYNYETRLIYANEAAPKLSFSRYPSGVSGKSEKEIEKYVKSKSKDLDKKEKKSIGKESSFTKMGNVEFDALFGADDRNNEVEFRLLFTPLAQTNEVDLIKNAEPFGDDFVFVKDKMINSIASAHSQNFDYSQDPNLFRSHSFEESHRKFVSYCDAFIKNLYFDLAPLLSIPLYQMHKSTDYIYNNDYPTNITSFEHEAMVNSMDPELFRPKKADPSLPLVLKQVGGQRNGEDSDLITVSGLSYIATPRVEFVSKVGGDGHVHQIPIHWVEYTEVKQDKGVEVGFVGASNKSYLSLLNGSLKSAFVNGKMSHYERGLLSFIDGITAFGQVKKEFK